ncbi:hypothetical protein CMI37_08970 [Candidatus Pacearchaeota archaeon]|nr:hypothetical protein [Candidatus Pacearchaeota archaeon]
MTTMEKIILCSHMMIGVNALWSAHSKMEFRLTNSASVQSDVRTRTTFQLHSNKIARQLEYLHLAKRDLCRNFFAVKSFS